MRYLLDTHTLLWFLQGSPKLSDAVATRIEAEDAENFVSIATVWEIAIKISFGKLRVPYSLDTDLPRILSENGFVTLPLAFSHMAMFTKLPFHHRDPFDRLLIAQATIKGLTILSRDSAFDAYEITREW